jgi:hypothetical protein
MHALSDFHHSASELLRHLGFELSPPGADQEVVSLTVDSRFDLHFGSIDADTWFMQADLGFTPPESAPTRLIQAMRANQLAAHPWQPVAALDDDNRLCCWLRLPAQGCDLPRMLTAFDALIACAEQLLNAALPHGKARP